MWAERLDRGQKDFAEKKAAPPRFVLVLSNAVLVLGLFLRLSWEMIIVVCLESQSRSGADEPFE